jgi:hypothetical protein
MKPALDLEETEEDMDTQLDTQLDTQIDTQLDDAPAFESGDQKDPLAG